MPRITAAVSAILVFLTVTPVSAQRSPVPGLDAYAQNALKEWDIPGMALAIVKDSSVVYERGYGVRKLGEKDAVDEHTLFSVASTSKAMTTACLAMLVDEGKLSWDDPVRKHLPGFELYDPWVTREMTVRDLLTHRSGLSRGDLLWYGSAFDRKEVVRRIRYLKPSTSFRSSYGYQNIMYITAGEVVEAVSGMTWDAFIRTRLFEPAGMRRSSTSVKDLAGVPNVASPHEKVNDIVTPVRWPNYDNVGAAGAVNSSAHDMAQWIRLQLGKGMIDGKRLIAEKSIDEMHTPFITNKIDSLTRVLRPMTNFITYGLGWSIQDYYGKKLVTHDGWLDGMRCRVAMLPELKLGVVVLLNGPQASLHGAIAYWILDHYLNVERRDWSSILLASVRESEAKDREREKERTTKKIPGTHPAMGLDAYVGTYEHEMYGAIDVTVKDELLRLSFGPMYIGTLEHRHYETFQVNWDDKTLGWDDVVFQQNAEGKVAKLEWVWVGTFDKKK